MDMQSYIESQRVFCLLLFRGVQCATLLFKFCVGVGWFSLPAAFQYSGVLVSTRVEPNFKKKSKHIDKFDIVDDEV
jgi:hypothetical protein